MAGRHSHVKVKREASYADTFPTTGMYKIPFTSEGFDIEELVRRSNNITNARAANALYNDGTRAPAALAGEACYDRLDHLINALLGTAVSTPGATTEATAISNLHTPGNTLPSFAFEVSKGDIDAGEAYCWSGVKGKAFELNWGAKGPLNFAFEGIGKNEVSANPGGTAQASSDVALAEDPISVGAHMTTVDIGTGADDAYCLKQGRIRIEQPLTEDDYCNGSDTVNEPDLDGDLVVTFEGLYKFTNRLLYNDFRSRTDVSLLFHWTSPNLAGAALSTYRSLDIRIPQFRYEAALPLIETPGMVLARVRGFGYGTGGSGQTTEPINITTVSEVDADSL